MSVQPNKPVTWTAPVSDQLKELTAARVLLLGLGLAFVVGLFVWGLSLRGLLTQMEELEKTAPKVMPLSPDDDPVLRKKSAEIVKRSAELKDIQREVDRLLTEREVPVGPEIYMQAVAQLDRLIATCGLSLIRHETWPPPSRTVHRTKKRESEKGLGGFGRRYQLYGQFSQLYEFLDELDSFPYLCRFEDLSLTAVRKSASDGPQAVHCEFVFKIYYRIGK